MANKEALNNEDPDLENRRKIDEQDFLAFSRNVRVPTTFENVNTVATPVLESRLRLLIAQKVQTDRIIKEIRMIEDVLVDRQIESEQEMED